MSETPSHEPWEELREILESRDAGRLRSFLEELPAEDVPLVLTRLHEGGEARLLGTLPADEAAGLLRELPDSQAAAILEALPADRAAAIVTELGSDEQTDLVARLSPPAARAVLDLLAPEELQDVRTLSRHEADTAGGLMITEYLGYRDVSTVADVLDDLRSHAEKYRRYDVQYAYVTTAAGTLTGVLRLRDLVLSPPGTPLTELMIRNPEHVTSTERLDELERFFDRHAFYGAPVTDEIGRLVGVVRRAHVEEALGERADRNLLKFSGIVGGEEFRTMPLGLRSRRRLAWLAINIVLNVVAASVIAVYRDTISAVIALAVFLPILSDMSGCSGNQAVAVSLRELALGLVRPRELGRVILKEAGVGFLNGAVLGTLLGGVAWLWMGSPALGLVVGAALAINTVIAACFGGGIPLVLKRLGFDPALASGPMLTTITDMCGFFLTLRLATFALPWLT